MHVHCSTCDEPWGTYHLSHDAIWDTGLPEEEIKAWERLPQEDKLKPKWRTAFESVGYVFGRTVINVLHCPGRPKGAEPDSERTTIKAEIESLLAGDEDGLAAIFEHHGL